VEGGVGLSRDGVDGGDNRVNPTRATLIEAAEYLIYCPEEQSYCC
tara:strand:- start:113 stop:247 length:135 start_codon:yes stop_codon:yes gene_type:complete